MTNVSLKDENGKIYYGWYIVAISLFFMALGYSCVVSIVGVFVMPITSELHIQIGDFVAWTTIMSVTSILYLFFASKHYNAKTVKPIMFVCALLGAVAFFGFSRATELWHFYLFAVPMQGKKLTSLPIAQGNCACLVQQQYINIACGLYGPSTHCQNIRLI